MSPLINILKYWKEFFSFYSVFLLCMISAVPFFIPAAGTANAADEIPEIRVGSELEFPPYAFTDDQGRPAGFSIDLIKAVADAMGLSIRITTGPWNVVWNDLVEGKLDALPIVAKLPERVKLVDFSLPHTETFDAFFVRKGEGEIQNVAAARNKEIVVMRDDAAHHALLDMNFEGKLVLVDTIPEGLDLVSKGKYDAFLCSKLIGTLAIKKHETKGLYAGPPIPDYKRTFSFAVKKGDDNLLEKLNQGLLIIKTNGVYDRLYEKWLSANDPWRKFTKYLLPTVITLITAIFVGSMLLLVLQRQVRRRTCELDEANAMLNVARLELEERVELRTRELTEANRNLQTEIAERKQAEKERERLVEELARSNKELKQFAYAASHDMKEPLRTVINFVQLLQKKYGESLDDRASQYMGFIVDGVEHMQKLIESLLAYSRIDIKKERLTKVSVNDAYEQAITNLSPSIKENKAVVTRDELPVIDGDEMQIVLLLQNLIGNGIKYHNAGDVPHVHVSATREDDTWTFVVRDNGIGIEQQYFEQIFQIFQRLHSYSQYSGTGIGLALCKRVVEQHNGKIWVESTPGQGTNFIFTFPSC